MSDLDGTPHLSTSGRGTPGLWACYRLQERIKFRFRLVILSRLSPVWLLSITPRHKDSASGLHVLLLGRSRIHVSRLPGRSTAAAVFGICVRRYPSLPSLLLHATGAAAAAAAVAAAARCAATHICPSAVVPSPSLPPSPPPRTPSTSLPGSPTTPRAKPAEQGAGLAIVCGVRAWARRRKVAAAAAAASS